MRWVLATIATTSVFCLNKLCLCSQVNVGPECFASLTNPYRLGATKTGYAAVQNDDDSPLEEDECELQFVWMLARHGTRNPSAAAIASMRRILPKIRDQIVSNHKEGKGVLCKEDLSNLRRWKMSLTAKNDSLLTQSGEQEMLGLGQRWSNRLGSLLINTSEEVGFTDTQRTIESARNFLTGFTGKEVDLSDMPAPIANQELLNFWVICERYRSLVKQKLKIGERHFTAFTLPGIKSLVTDINRRLGYLNNTLSFKAVDLMWDMCRFELSFYYEGNNTHPEKYPWCAVFTEKDMKLLEDNEDLYYYYKDGYPFNITLDMTRVLLNDLLHSVSASSNRFYFGHSETIIPLLARLGIAKDDPPLSLENLPQDRKWRTSLIGGESANLAVVGYQCQGSKKLKFYLNERPVSVEGCNANEFCDTADFIQRSQNYSAETLGNICKV